MTLEGESETQYPVFLASKDNSEDRPTFIQAINSKEGDQWYEAMLNEWNKLIEVGAWEEVPKEEAEGHNVLGTTWALRIRETPMDKYISSKQDSVSEGINKWERLITLIPILQ